MTTLRISATAARRLLLGAQGLLEDPGRHATQEELLATIRRLGFLQLDTINVAGRAHDLTLHSRLAGHRSEGLHALLEVDRSLFEGWTHDASVIPAEWYAHWKPRFRRDAPRIEAHPWWRNLLGGECQSVCEHVLARIREEGPLGSADFEHPEKRGPWWGWKPQKAALDYLWRTGRLAVARRVNFHKRYDLPERVLREAGASEPEAGAHREWVFASAAERLLVFTARELAAFWEALEPAEARAWCSEAVAQGRLRAALIEAADGSVPQSGFVLADWEARLAGMPEAPAGLRLLSPFDPILRDRARALRRFAFDYRFEAFTPEAKRRYGYYAMPVLEGERLVARVDPKLHRDRGLLELRGLWWEPGVRPTRARVRGLERALEGLAAFLGAGTLDRARLVP